MMSITLLSQTISIKDSLIYKFNPSEVKELHNIILDRDYLIEENGNYKMQLDSYDVMINDYTLAIEDRNSVIQLLRSNIKLNEQIIVENKSIITTLETNLKKTKLSRTVFIITTGILTGILIIK